jgi:hypothetical protein
MKLSLNVRAASGRIARLLRDPSVRIALATFIIIRVVLSVWMWGVRQAYPVPLPPHPILRPYVGVAVETNPWLEPWQRWDTLHYQAIAERGYAAFDSALFVPPLYPLLMRGLGALLGGRTLLAGILISNLACLGCLIAMYRLTLQEMADSAAARRSVIYLASFPAAFFLLAAYTESLYLLAAILALYAVGNKRWWTAGVWGAVASLTRLPGALIVVPLAYAAWEAWRREHAWPVWSAVVLTLIGAAVFPLYVWLGLHLPPWTPLLVQSARFGGGLTWPGANMLEAARRILAGQFYVADVLDLVFLLIFLMCAVPVCRKLSRVCAIYYAVLLLSYLTRIGGQEPLLSTARYVLALFPALMLWGKWGERPWVNRFILYPAWVGLLFMSGQFAVWGWVG